MVGFEKLNGEYIVQSVVLIGHSESICLGTNTFEDAKRANPSWLQFLILES